ncbi:putative membrane protein, partial [Clostridioides difficile CD8]
MISVIFILPSLFFEVIIQFLKFYTLNYIITS